MDRNSRSTPTRDELAVASCEGGVDRGTTAAPRCSRSSTSPPARGTWIATSPSPSATTTTTVASREGGVDCNTGYRSLPWTVGRCPFRRCRPPIGCGVGSRRVVEPSHRSAARVLPRLSLCDQQAHFASNRAHGKGAVNGPAKFPLFDPVFPLFRHNRPDHGLTARTADRAVLIGLRRFLAGIHAILETPDKREVGSSSLPRPIAVAGLSGAQLANHGELRMSLISCRLLLRACAWTPYATRLTS